MALTKSDPRPPDQPSIRGARHSIWHLMAAVAVVALVASAARNDPGLSVVLLVDAVLVWVTVWFIRLGGMAIRSWSITNPVTERTSRLVELLFRAFFSLVLLCFVALTVSISAYTALFSLYTAMRFLADLFTRRTVV